MTDENKETNGASPLTGLFFLFLFGISLLYPANCVYYRCKADGVRKEIDAKILELTDITITDMEYNNGVNEINKLNETYWDYRKKAHDPWYDSR